MIQFTLEIDKQSQLITAPASWNEISFRQLLEIENEEAQAEGLIRLFSIVCGIDFQGVAESVDRTLFKKIRDVCAFVNNPPDWKRVALPRQIELNGAQYKVPKKVNTIMHGQIELLQQIGARGKIMDDMALAVAIIMQPTVDGGKYDGDRVKEIREWVLNANGMAAWGIATFFFQKLASFLPIGIRSLKQSQEPSIRKLSYYKDWLKVKDLERSVQSVQST